MSEAEEAVAAVSGGRRARQGLDGGGMGIPGQSWAMMGNPGQSWAILGNPGQSSGDLCMHVVVALGLASTGCLRIGFLRLALELACASGHCGLGACEPRVWCGVHVCVGVCGVAHV